MKKLWRIFAYEYSRQVWNKRFLFGLMSVPLLIGVMILLILLIERTQTDLRPAGYIDHSGFLSNPVFPPQSEQSEKPIQIIAYTDEEQAKMDLETKKIQAYFVLEESYLIDQRVRMVALEKIPQTAQTQFKEFLSANLLVGQPEEVVQRFFDGNHLVVRSADGTREMAEEEWFNIMMPFFAGIAFMVAMLTSSGYLMQAVVEEKENRTMEVLVTSIAPWQIMTGKIIGNIATGLSQMAAWIGMGIIFVLVGRNYLSWLENVRVTFEVVLQIATVMLPGFVMVASLLAAVGATVTEAREGQQITGLFTLPVMVPYWLMPTIMENPNGPLAVGLSFFPFTAPVTLTMRLGFAVVPTGQLIANFIILYLSALAALWLAGRTFRLGMLRYGKRLSLREVFSKAA